jgi:uncharacterized protein with GYD domain
MATYLVAFRQTADTWARLIANPEDRRKTVAPLIEAAGGRLDGYWYAFGEADGYVLFQAPDDVVAAAVVTRVAASGAFASVSTTKLLTVEETMDALGRVSALSYRAPGGA